MEYPFLEESDYKKLIVRAGLPVNSDTHACHIIASSNGYVVLQHKYVSYIWHSIVEQSLVPHTRVSYYHAVVRVILITIFSC